MKPTPDSFSDHLNLLTAREAADYLRMSLTTLHRIERRGLLSPLRTPGGHRRYTLEMLNDCLSHPAFLLEEKSNGTSQYLGD